MIPMIAKGCVVRALSGHDRGALYVVVGAEEGRLLLADGQLKTLDAPKKKNCRHVVETGRTVLAERFAEGSRIEDREIRYALKEIKREKNTICGGSDV